MTSNYKITPQPLKKDPDTDSSTTCINEEVSSDSSTSSEEEEKVESSSKIVMNLSHCKYKIIDSIVDKTFGFEVSRGDSGNWDIFWADSVTSPNNK